MPRGFDVEEERARLLRHSALYAHTELPASLATGTKLAATLLGHWRDLAPLHTWLTNHVP
jgi:hypothetical protein